MAQNSLSALELTDFPLTDERIVSAIRIHQSQIMRNLRVGKITPEALNEIEERLDVIGDLAELGSLMRKRCAA